MKVFVCGSVDKHIKPEYLEGISKIAENLLAHNDGVMCVGATTGSIGEMYKSMIAGDGFVDIIVPTPYAHEAQGMIANSVTAVDTLFMLQQVALRNTDLTIVLPGGNGTLAELYMITDSIKSKFDTDKVLIYNINGFYNHLKEMNDFMFEAGVLTKFQYDFFTWCETPEQIIAEIEKVREQKLNNN
ncbi:MAG: LOG family protein [Clostridia bacterium]|nr:LOG family protein [Clostridia bacterium]